MSALTTQAFPIHTLISLIFVFNIMLFHSSVLQLASLFLQSTEAISKAPQRPSENKLENPMEIFLLTLTDVHTSRRGKQGQGIILGTISY